MTKRLDRFAWNFQGRCGVTPDELITFLVNSEKPRDAAMRNMGTGFVVLRTTACLFIFLRPRYSVPEGWKIKKRIERVWNGHGADSETGNVSASIETLDGDRQTLEQKGGSSRVSRHLGLFIYLVIYLFIFIWRNAELVSAIRSNLHQRLEPTGILRQRAFVDDMWHCLFRATRTERIVSYAPAVTHLHNGHDQCDCDTGWRSPITSVKIISDNNKLIIE